MSTLKDIQAPVKEEMNEFELKFRQSMKSKVMLLDKIMDYIIKRKGKQMRPLFVFLTAAITGNINEATHRGAALIELLHTASLVHDDVVDNAHYRRGFFSINALWKNKIAVLVGDFLLSKGLLLSLKNDDFELLRIVSNAVQQMSEGELLQMEKARKLDITEELYYEVIRQKTASLITSCCQVGASSGGGTAEDIAKMGTFGTNVGMAFQIKDDLFDYENAAIGKPTGIDIRERKMTLPVIYALKHSSSSEVSTIKKMITDSEKKSANVKKIIEFVVAKGGIDYATKRMNDFLSEAIAILKSYPDSVYRNSLEQLLAFTIARKT
ncbi:MAG: polyprenyl synthetase family protein [Cyclobacteriaceae bacterium]|jgi:octaprenyl-diphosphate synthase|nr:polyprenyl synthetase family protein [Cyclobacteriaceae bacterium]|tara:strand:- start:309 stop:1280 length:972 start_codon:yes stop_codon:yes gene_type:complete